MIFAVFILINRRNTSEIADGEIVNLTLTLFGSYTITHITRVVVLQHLKNVKRDLRVVKKLKNNFNWNFSSVTSNCIYKSVSSKKRNVAGSSSNRCIVGPCEPWQMRSRNYKMFLEQHE